MTVSRVKFTGAFHTGSSSCTFTREFHSEVSWVISTENVENDVCISFYIIMKKSMCAGSRMGSIWKSWSRTRSCSDRDHATHEWTRHHDLWPIRDAAAAGLGVRSMADRRAPRGRRGRGLSTAARGDATAAVGIGRSRELVELDGEDVPESLVARDSCQLRDKVRTGANRTTGTDDGVCSGIIDYFFRLCSVIDISSDARSD